MATSPAHQWDFPKEIWQRIIYFIPRMKEQPHWHAWTELRNLNNTFKSIINDYYFEHYLTRMKFRMVSSDIIDWCGGYRDLNFVFDRLEDPDKRIAVFVDGMAKTYSKCEHERHAKLVKEAFDVSLTEDPGFNCNTIVTVRRELTDMLPIDLKVDFTPGKCTLKFDWRTYLCTYFDEERQKQAIADEKQPGFMQEADRIKQQLMTGQISLEDVFAEAIKIIAPFAGEGAEGLLVPVRRKRRLRIGLKHPKNKDWLESNEFGEDTQKNFAEHDEEMVVEHLKRMRQDVSAEQFSDSSDDEDVTEDEKSDAKDGAEDDEWEDEEDDEEGTDE